MLIFVRIVEQIIEVDLMEVDNVVAIEILKTFRDAMDTPITEYRDVLLGSLDRAIKALDFIDIYLIYN